MRVVTLPQVDGVRALELARDARRRGAELLELRTDLHGGDLPVEPLARELPLLVSERAGKALPPRWIAAARFVDRELSSLSQARVEIVSHHAPEPLGPAEALALWQRAPVPPAAQIKHVEPLGAPASAARLLETRRLLRERFGERVTVLATGPLALPFRAVLAGGNALDYLALSPAWQSAPGQRLLDDAVRAARAPRGAPRLGILGTSIAGSRSPRIHAQPFDRIDLPEDAPLGEILDALHPHYRGFAVTSPFKQAAARHVGSPLDAVNTLVRTRTGWESANTDVDGAREVLRRLTGTGSAGASTGSARTGGTGSARTGGTGSARTGDPGNPSAGNPTAPFTLSGAKRSRRARVRSASSPSQLPTVTILGSGGATAAILVAAGELGITCQVLRRSEVSSPIRGPVIWTWPERIAAPSGLAFEGATVAVISYGAAGRRIRDEIRARGGIPLLAGAAWFVAQARGQRARWEQAT